MSKNATQHDPPTPSAADSSWVRVIVTAALVTLAVAYQLYRTASITGNYEGLWFSLVHTLLVAVGVVCALRPERVKDPAHSSR